VRVIVLDTTIRRGLVDSAYNKHVAQCRTAASQLGIPSLRGITLNDFNAKSNTLDDRIRRRAQHVISENDRAQQAAKALERGDIQTFGQLMNASHISLRDDYEVSNPELNIMVELAQKQSDYYSARMTGAGFGGCAIALVQKEVANTFVENICSSYQKHTGLQPNIYICEASDGVKVLD
jgi:galactokinase